MAESLALLFLQLCPALEHSQGAQPSLQMPKHHLRQQQPLEDEATLGQGCNSKEEQLQPLESTEGRFSLSHKAAGSIPSSPAHNHLSTGSFSALLSGDPATAPTVLPVATAAGGSLSPCPQRGTAVSLGAGGCRSCSSLRTGT